MGLASELRLPARRYESAVIEPLPAIHAHRFRPDCPPGTSAVPWIALAHDDGMRLRRIKACFGSSRALTPDLVQKPSAGLSHEQRRMLEQVVNDLQQADPCPD